MTLEQVILIRDSYMKDDGSGRNTVGTYMKFALDGGIDFVTSKDLVIFDDDNKLLHAICINENMVSQADYPIKMISANYDVIQQIESIFTVKNFEEVLNSGFLSPIVSDKKKGFIKSFASKIKNHNIAPKSPTPYYTTEPNIVPRKAENLERDDGIKHPTSSSSRPIIKTVGTFEDLKNMLVSASSGDVIFVNNSVSINEPMKIDKSISLISNGASISNTINIANNVDDVFICGFNIDVSSSSATADDAKKNNIPMILASSKSFTLTNCTFTARNHFYNAIRINCTDKVVIEGNIFEGGNFVYNAIEFSQDKKNKISNIIIKNNTFKTGSCTNNTISLFQFNNNTSVLIEGNHWGHSANALRISNYSNANPVTIICKNNRYDSVSTTNEEYIGFMLAQAVNNDDFSNVTVIFDNLIGPGGVQLRENGTGINQVWYTYNSTTEPVVIFK